jgi:hypothetical protein
LQKHRGGIQLPVQSHFVRSGDKLICRCGQVGFIRLRCLKFLIEYQE